jgi:CubicO group peptidase (beta-lactamase class C family)
VTNDTPFWIASNAKQFAASALLALEEAGTLSTADSIGRFFEGLPPDKRGITLHQLLTHSAGLVQRYAADGITDREEAVRALLDTALVYPPGTGFGYSNDAYNLIAAVVEVASGRPYESFVGERILGPAGLTHTGFWGPREHPEVAAIYGAEVADSSSMRPSWGFRGATGMYSTSGDFYQWHLTLQGHRVLSAASVSRLQGEHVARGETQVGYGWFTSRTAGGARTVWTRGYEGFGHGAYLGTYPESGTVIVILTNSGERDGTPVSHRLAKQLEALVFEDEGPGVTSPTP